MTSMHRNNNDWINAMVERVMVNVEYALSLGMSKEEAIKHAKARSTAGSKVWEIVAAKVA